MDDDKVTKEDIELAQQAVIDAYENLGDARRVLTRAEADFGLAVEKRDKLQEEYDRQHD